MKKASPNWISSNIGRECEIVAGQSPRGEFYNDQGDGIPFYQGKKEFGYKSIKQPTTWTTHTTKQAYKDDILMSVRAPVGPVNFCTQKICIGRGLASIRAGKNLNNHFLYYYFIFNENKIKGNEGAVFASISKDQIAAIQILVPSLPEQRRIVAILDDAFERIDKAIANTEKNIANAKELFESCLESTFANIVGKTTSCKIKECTKFIDYRGKTPEKTECGLRLITAKNVKKGVLQKTPEEFVSPEVYDTWMTRGIPKIGDVLFTTEQCCPVKQPELIG